MEEGVKHKYGNIIPSVIEKKYDPIFDMNITLCDYSGIGLHYAVLCGRSVHARKAPAGIDI